MVRDILNSTAVGKLKGILKDRYGKGLRVSFIQDLSSLEIQEEDFVLAQGDLHIPIQVNDKYLATAIVEKGADLREIEQETVSQLVRLFLEPEVFNWYVQQMTHNSKVATPQNIVPLFEPIRLIGEDGSKQNSVTTNILCLQTSNPHLVSRLAQNIHEVSGRWAYLRFADIQSQITGSADLKALGALTLLIEDILQLSPALQEIIHSSISNSRPSEEPLILIGCTSSVEELEIQKMVHPGLAKIMKVHRLEVERLPRDPKLLQETLEIMLEF